MKGLVLTGVDPVTTVLAIVVGFPAKLMLVNIIMTERLNVAATMPRNFRLIGK
jgi:hypothetical protein